MWKCLGENRHECRYDQDGGGAGGGDDGEWDRACVCAVGLQGDFAGRGAAVSRSRDGDDTEKSRSGNQKGQDSRGGKGNYFWAAEAGDGYGGHRGGGFCSRSGAGNDGDQAGGAWRGGWDSAVGRDYCEQYFVDFRDGAGGADKASGPFCGDALHESSAGDDAGGNDSGAADERCDVRNDDEAGGKAGEEAGGGERCAGVCLEPRADAADQ